MKKALIFLFILIFIGGCALLGAYIWSLDYFWDFESSKKSPNGSYTIYEYQYTSDSDRHAPYGTYLFIQPTSYSQNPINGYVIFAGYCGENMNYSWVNNNEIVVACDYGKPENLRSLARKAYGIQIHFKSPSS